MKLMQKGFTLIEITIVVVVIGLLTTIVIVSVGNPRERTYQTRAFAEMNTLANATRLYLEKYNDFPPDVNRDIPAGLNEFIDFEGEWPDAPWPGSVFDYDNWTIDGEQVVQISVRFCPIGGSIDECQFPDEEWADGFDVQSAAYYCLKGACRAHNSRPYNHPGYCINCTTQPSDT
jgi:prepilin-type N-terminal cleavage/methylation domain-containing protein